MKKSVMDILKTKTMETKLKKLTEKINLLSYDYQRLSSSGQETYLQIIKELEQLNN